MKIKHILSLVLFLSMAASYSTFALATETDSIIHYPPDSLQQWYKPVNKRQVWLHTMFRLRRALQAIEDYAEKQDMTGMHKWMQQLEKDYTSLAEMVPEWNERVDRQLVSELAQAINSGDINQSRTLTRNLRKNCVSCHDDYQPLVAAMYRSPDYDHIKLADENNSTLSFHKAMEALSISINRILIAMDDNVQASAIQASLALNQQLDQLATSCNQCHKDTYPTERILGKATQQTLQQIDMAIKSGQDKDTKKLLGDIGVTVCSRCHNIHRTLYDLKNVLQK